MNSEILLAFSVRRRVVTLVCFSGTRLTSCRRRELRTALPDAESATRAFVGKAISDFAPVRIAVERGDRMTARKTALTDIVRDIALQASIPCWDVPAADVAAGVSEPPSLRPVVRRTIARGLWPILLCYPGLIPGALDAALLGLYVQVEAELATSESEGGSDGI